MIPQEVQVLIEVMREDMESMIAKHKVAADYRFNTYKNYIDAGFDEKQALHLVANDANRVGENDD